jgi:NADH:ubiquinone oxidoreductase subunit F (NADH-binding)
MPLRELLLEHADTRDLTKLAEYEAVGGYESLKKAVTMERQAVLDELLAANVRGRGGAGFPMGRKASFLPKPEDTPKPIYLVVNADESEPGTFKDRELMLRVPHLFIEGVFIAAYTIASSRAFIYVRGEYLTEYEVVVAALEEAREAGYVGKDVLGSGWDLTVVVHRGGGAYICGEETAMLEALEGKRGMPRHKPPFPTEHGLWGKPTLIQNVETIACVPAIVRRGGDWFRALGRTEPGTKLYSISGDVARPGTYELPLGVCLDELVEAAGGYRGELFAFSPGGASSGFLPASERTRPLAFKSLAAIGSMMGSAGVVVLGRDYPIADAVRDQLWFFEVESCGQCAPCRIGTRFLRESLDAGRLDAVDEVAWEMTEGSICGLGQTAPLPLTSAVRHFPGLLKK